MNKKKTKQELLTCTRVLYIMSILGFMANYMLRVNLSIAIIDMISTPNTTNFTVEAHRFNWDITQKNDLLGVFFWGYILTDVIGGRLAEIFGPRKIFGGGMLVASLITVATPAACYGHYYVGMFARFALGLSLGVTFPCIAPLAVKWIPPSDLSKFMSNLLSQGIGVAISFPMCGYLMSVFAWPSVFYLTGALGLLWCLAWFCLIYDSPAQHPRISDKEKDDIEEQMCGKKRNKPGKLPWGRMLMSPAVWAVIIAHACLGFCHFLIITQLPTFMKDVLHLDLRKNGLLSSLPSLGQYILALIGAYTADRICKSKKLSLVSIRKVFTSLSSFIPALFTIVLVVWGQNSILAVLMIITSFSFIGLMSAGHLPNAIDIAPNFSGTIIGLATTLASLAGALSTKIVSVLTKDNSSFDSWKYVFSIMVVVYLVGGLTYVSFGKAHVQDWNSDKRMEQNGNKQNGTEDMVPLSIVSR